MSRKIKQSLFQQILGRCRSTTVSSLQRRGVKKVRVIGVDQINGLIEQAVDRVIAERMLSLEDRERDRIVRDAREELNRLSEEVTHLESTRDRTLKEVEVAEQRVDDLRRRVRIAEQDLEQERRSIELDEVLAGGAEAASDELLKGISSVVQGALQGEKAEDDGELSDKLTSRLAALVSTHITRANSQREELQECSNERIEILERRMAKLRRKLEDAENQLVQSTEGEIDPGIASIYREVQGLSRTETDFKRKQGLMTVIFEANRDLQRE